MYNYRINYIKSNCTFNNLRKDIKSLLNINEEEIVIFINKGLIHNFDINKLRNNYKYIEKVLEQTDLFYLINFMDDCEKIDIIHKTKDINFYHLKSPNGFYGVAAKKEKWKEILELMTRQEEENISDKLNTLVVKNKLKASSSWPQIYDLDILKLNPESRNQYSKCRNDLNVDSKIERIHSLSYNYFLIGCIMFTIFIIYSQK